MQSHKSFLNDVLGDLALPREPQRVGEQGRFESWKELFYRFAPGRLDAGLIGSHYCHDRRICACFDQSVGHRGFSIPEDIVSLYV
jgi:hypothetical protein